jgi:hypothetical protein
MRFICFILWWFTTSQISQAAICPANSYQILPNTQKPGKKVLVTSCYNEPFVFDQCHQFYDSIICDYKSPSGKFKIAQYFEDSYGSPYTYSFHRGTPEGCPHSPKVKELDISQSRITLRIKNEPHIFYISKCENKNALQRCFYHSNKSKLVFVEYRKTNSPGAPSRTFLLGCK